MKKYHKLISIFSFVIILPALLVFFYLTNQNYLQSLIGENKTEKDILYAGDNFVFYYPQSLEIYQTVDEGVLQWKPKSADRVMHTSGLDALTLRSSTSLFSEIKQNKEFSIWNLQGYNNDIFKATAFYVKEESVVINNHNSKLYMIDCGTECNYALFRYTSNSKNYEMIYNLNLGNLSIFKELISSLQFSDPNLNEWRSYVSPKGKFSISFPSSSTFMEDVLSGFEGFKSYDPNYISIYPGGFILNFKDVGNVSVDDYVSNWNSESCSADLIDETKYFTVDHEKAIYQASGCGPAGSFDVFIKHKNILYHIENAEVDDPILNTLKFVD